MLLFSNLFGWLPDNINGNKISEIVVYCKVVCVQIRNNQENNMFFLFSLTHLLCSGITVYKCECNYIVGARAIKLNMALLPSPEICFICVKMMGLDK